MTGEVDCSFEDDRPGNDCDSSCQGRSVDFVRVAGGTQNHGSDPQRIAQAAAGLSDKSCTSGTTRMIGYNFDAGAAAPDSQDNYNTDWSCNWRVGKQP